MPDSVQERVTDQGQTGIALHEKPLRFDSLNIFRFLAALTIVFFHFRIPVSISFWSTDLHVPTSFFDGPDMVTFFFVLSGFAMTLSYYSRENPGRSYWINRAARIYPVYLFSLLLAIIASGRYSLDFVLMLNLGLVQSWFPQHVMEINGPAWALSVQAFFYALFPLVLFQIRRRGYDPYNVILASGMFWLLTQAVLTALLNSSLYQDVGSISHEVIFHSPFPHLCSFILGIAGGYLLIKEQYLLQLPRRRSYGLIILAAFILLIFGCAGVFQRSIGLRIPTGASLFGPAFLLLILSIAMAWNTPFSRLLSSRPLIILGSSSYAVYLLQMPLYTLLYRFVLPLPGISEGMNLYIFLFAEIGISILTFYIIERPGADLIRHLLILMLC